MMSKINEVIEQDIRPFLLEHEGDIEVLSFQDGICRVRLNGKCSNCPSAFVTTEELIKKKLMNALEEVKDVVLVQETSPELLDMAKKILNHEL